MPYVKTLKNQWDVVSKSMDHFFSLCENFDLNCRSVNNDPICVSELRDSFFQAKKIVVDGIEMLLSQAVLIYQSSDSIDMAFHVYLDCDIYWFLRQVYTMYNNMKRWCDEPLVLLESLMDYWLVLCVLNQGLCFKKELLDPINASGYALIQTMVDRYREDDQYMDACLNHIQKISANSNLPDSIIQQQAECRNELIDYLAHYFLLTVPPFYLQNFSGLCFYLNNLNDKAMTMENCSDLGLNRHSVFFDAYQALLLKNTHLAKSCQVMAKVSGSL